MWSQWGRYNLPTHTHYIYISTTPPTSIEIFVVKMKSNSLHTWTTEIHELYELHWFDHREGFVEVQPLSLWGKVGGDDCKKLVSMIGSCYFQQTMVGSQCEMIIILNIEVKGVLNRQQRLGKPWHTQQSTVYLTLPDLTLWADCPLLFSQVCQVIKHWLV